MNVERIISDSFSQLRDLCLSANEVVEGYKSLFKIKKARAGYIAKDYLDVMYANVGFLNNCIEESLRLFKSFLIRNNFPNENEFNARVLAYRDMLRKKSAYILEDIKKLYNKYQTINEKIDQIEFDYMFLKTYDELVNNFVISFVQHPLENRTIAYELFKCEPDEVAECIKKYAVINAHIIIGNFKFNI